MTREAKTKHRSGVGQGEWAPHLNFRANIQIFRFGNSKISAII